MKVFHDMLCSIIALVTVYRSRSEMCLMKQPVCHKLRKVVKNDGICSESNFADVNKTKNTYYHHKEVCQSQELAVHVIL